MQDILSQGVGASSIIDRHILLSEGKGILWPSVDSQNFTLVSCVGQDVRFYPSSHCRWFEEGMHAHLFLTINPVPAHLIA